MNKVYSYIIFLAFSSMLLVQCKAKKPLIDSKAQITLSKSKADTIVKNVIANNFQYQDLKAKINTRFKSRERNNLAFGTFIKMKKDSAIHATISVLNIPIVVALITPDSLKFINKKDRKYFVGEFSYVSEMLKTDLSFNQLQDLLVGNPVMTDTLNSHYLIEENNDFFISTLSKNELVERSKTAIKKGEWKVKYWINELYKTGKTIISNDSTNTRIEIFQADYKKVAGQNFPNRTKAEIVTANDSISVHLNYQRVKINSNVQFSFSIPEHYTPYE